MSWNPILEDIYRTLAVSDPLEGIPVEGKNVFACPFPARFVALSYCEQGDAFECCNMLANKMLPGCKLLSVSHWENISLIREGFYYTR